MGEPCDICGDMGVREALYTCSKCKIGREHLQPFADDVPALWLCGACDLPKTSMLDPSAMVDQENAHSAGFSETRKDSRGCGRFKWEKTVQSGKVKYISAREAMMLSSGAKDFASRAKRNLHSSVTPSKIVPSMPARTPIKLKVLSPKSSQSFKANPSFETVEPLPPRHCNSQINLVVKQQAVRMIEDSKGAPGLSISVQEKKAGLTPRKGYINERKPIDTLKPAVETKIESITEVEKENKESFDSFSSLPVMHFPPLSSSGTQTSCGNVESRNLDVKDGGLVTVLPKPEKCFHGPALDSSWTGSFKIIDSISREELNDGFKAHPPSTVRGKVYEFSKKMPKVLQFKMLPRDNVWTDIFEDYYPTEDDIGLYFFSSDSQRSLSYIALLELIETRDVVMRSYIDGVELLMFSSKHLSSNSQRWNDDKYFLWGVFRNVKKCKAVSKLNEELPRLSRPSDSTNDNNANGDSSLVDRQDMRRVDKAILSRESSTRACGSAKVGNATVSRFSGTVRHTSQFSGDL
ncbi:uncharacterized protein LOC131299182 isoform X2 [Rhododendron vialii]|uniref:uncharacterized protein LOC131299182 isoform X2 n=1 Tax=Rhododendron vialii TaxID=182163 RepID=UPI00265FB7D7|nr:uncharacterized protein LOC131299182 isoform X2 [Rhododendron vialii]